MPNQKYVSLTFYHDPIHNLQHYILGGPPGKNKYIEIQPIAFELEEAINKGYTEYINQLTQLLKDISHSKLELPQNEYQA